MSDSGKHGAGHVWRHPYTHADMHRRKMTRAHPFTDTTRHSRTFDTSSPPPQFARCSSREPLSNCWPLIASPDLILALNSGRTRSRNAVRVTIFGSWDASIVVSVGDRGGGEGVALLCSALLSAGRRRQSLSKVLKVGALPPHSVSPADDECDLCRKAKIDWLQSSLFWFGNSLTSTHLDPLPPPPRPPCNRWMYTRTYVQQDWLLLSNVHLLRWELLNWLRILRER